MTTPLQDPSQRIADHFDELVRKTPGGPPWSHGDEVVWHVVSTRCEIDMNGFASVFEQCLDRNDVAFLITAFEELEEPDLARAFAAAQSLLFDAGFDAMRMNCADLPADVQERLSAIGASIVKGNRLWGIDGKLVRLLDREG